MVGKFSLFKNANLNYQKPTQILITDKIFFLFRPTHKHRSQLSICSEPMANVKQLSCQSSVEPCVLEEEIIDTRETRAVIESTASVLPDSLILSTTNIEDATSTSVSDAKKFLYRSQSTRSFKKTKMKKPSKLLSSDLDQIYVISSNACTRDDFYDSIEVISERRSKNFMVELNNGSEGACDNGSVNNNAATKAKEIVVVDIES